MRLVLVSLLAIVGACEQAAKMGDELAATPPGQLSATTKRLIAAGTDGSSKGISAAIATGQQIAPVASEIRGALESAVDGDTVIEPIYMKVESENEVDIALEDVPHVEIVEGVHIGIRRLDDLQAAKQTTERAYLIAWRDGDHLIGLVYRTRRSVDYEALIREVPRLVSLTQSALKS